MKVFSWPGLFSSSDETAMCQVRTDDDAEAFSGLVARWQGPIRNLCTRMTGDIHRGEDLAQETFVRLYTRRKNYEPKARFSTFLWRMALNLCYDELRKIKRRRELSLEDPQDADGGSVFDPGTDEPGPDDCLAGNERAEAVRHALVELEEPYRVVVVLRHYEGLKFREIADVLELPEGTVKSRMFEAVSRLNKTLNSLLGDKPQITARPREKLLI
ncbi:MAG: polymerase sigma-70 factor, subfamily [Verrucomicrobiota bacterium]